MAILSDGLFVHKFMILFIMQTSQTNEKMVSFAIVSHIVDRLLNGQEIFIGIAGNFPMSILVRIGPLQAVRGSMLRGVLGSSNVLLGRPLG